MRGEVGKETPKKEMNYDVFLWHHTWNFPYILMLVTLLMVKCECVNVC